MQMVRYMGMVRCMGMGRYIGVGLLLSLSAWSCSPSGETTDAPTTNPPTTDAPTTNSQTATPTIGGRIPGDRIQTADEATAGTPSPSNPGTDVYVLNWEQPADQQGLSGAAGAPPFWKRDWLPRTGNEDGRQPVELSQQQARCGQHAVRFDLRVTDTARPSNNARCELSSSPSGYVPLDTDYWYGFSIYLPDKPADADTNPDSAKNSEEWAPDTDPEILTQWHQWPGGGSPPLSIGTHNDQWIVSRKKWPGVTYSRDPGPEGECNDSPDNKVTCDKKVGAYKKGVWTTWVVHVRWSHTNGIIEIWKDKDREPVLTQPNGQTTYIVAKDEEGHDVQNTQGNYLKIGIYKWPWNDGATGVNQPTKRVMYHDEVRVAVGADRKAKVQPNCDAPPTAVCDTLRAQIADWQGEVADIQEDLRSGDIGRRQGAGARIRGLRNKIRVAKQRMQQLGCPPPPP